MKILIINIGLLLMLIIFPVLPSYLHLYNEISSPKLKLCIESGGSGKIKILKGDLAYLEAIFSRALENKNHDDPISHGLNNTINILFFISQPKIEFINPLLIKIDKLFFSKNNLLSTIYLKIPSPPPKYIF